MIIQGLIFLQMKLKILCKIYSLLTRDRIGILAGAGIQKNLILEDGGPKIYLSKLAELPTTGLNLKTHSLRFMMI